MDAVQALKTAIDSSHGWYQGTCADVTQAQADFLPDGVAHPIGELMAHILQSEDGIINGMLQGKPPLWESEGWGEKLGVPNVMGHTNEQARGFSVDIAALAPYQEAVFAQTEAYLGSLSAEDLEREVPGPNEPMTVAQALGNALVGNNFAHTGEISALKGLLGAKGYAF